MAQGLAPDLADICAEADRPQNAGEVNECEGNQAFKW